MWQFFSLWYCIFTMLKYQHWYAGNAAYICWISSMYMLKFQHRVAIPNPLQPPHLLNFEVSILQYQNENSKRNGFLLFLSWYQFAECEPLKIVKLVLRKSEKGCICNSFYLNISKFTISKKSISFKNLQFQWQFKLEQNALERFASWSRHRSWSTTTKTPTMPNIPTTIIILIIGALASVQQQRCIEMKVKIWNLMTWPAQFISYNFLFRKCIFWKCIFHRYIVWNLSSKSVFFKGVFLNGDLNPL